MKKIIAIALVIIMLFALASCSKIKDAIEDAKDEIENEIEENFGESEDEITDEGEQPDEQPEEQPDEQEDYSDNEFIQNIQFEESDDVMKWTFSNIEYIYIFDGDKVVRYINNIDYEDEETAKAMENTYKYVMASNDSGEVKALERNGSVVTIEYNESAFSMTTREEVEEAFNSIKALQALSGN